MKLWLRIHIIIRSVIIGFLILLAGNAPWAILVRLNYQYYSSVPWAAIVMLIYLFLFWQYLRGRGWPRLTSEPRKNYLRARSLSVRVWLLALLSGVLGWVCLLSIKIIFEKLTNVPQAEIPDFSAYPVIIVISNILVTFISAGFIEEAAFRGYMQAPIELWHGPIIAIFIVGIFFGIAHYSHTSMTLTAMPLFLGSSIILGVVAYFTKSILPCIVIHIIGNILALTEPWLEKISTSVWIVSALLMLPISIWCFLRLRTLTTSSQRIES